VKAPTVLRAYSVKREARPVLASLAAAELTQGPAHVGTGHLRVTVSGPDPAALHVETTQDEPSYKGFAKVAAYMPIGPGGGVLTQCTVRDDALESDTSTAQYGIVYGESISCLADLSTGSDESKAEKPEGLTP